MEFSTYLSIVCLALIVKAQDRATEAEILLTTVDNTDDNITEDWADLASQAVKLLLLGADLLKSQIGKLLLN